MWGKKKEGTIPRELRLLDGGMAMDGGTTRLQAQGDGRTIVLHLDWSIDAQQNGRTRFTADGREIAKGSPDEAAWLARVREAAARMPAYDPNRPMRRQGMFLLSEQDLAYFKAMEQGAQVALRVLAERFADLVASETHQRATSPADDAVRALVAEGRRIEAVQAYREAHPGVTTAEARAAVERMATDLRNDAEGV